MKKLITIVLLLVACRSFSQDSLTVYNYMRNQIAINGTKFLAGWSVANIAVGATGWASTNVGTTSHYFYQMTTIWNIANLGAVAYGYTMAWNAQNRLSQQASQAAQSKMETTFLINDGLDVVYLGVGAYVYHKGTSENKPIAKGYGSAILLQGAFLLIFDTTMYAFEKHNGTKLRHFINKNPIAFDGRKISITFNI